MGDTTIYKPPRPIRGWTVQATCPDCGQILEHVADGRPNGHTARAVAQCGGCAKQWAVQITLTDVTSRVGRRRRLIGRQVP